MQIDRVRNPRDANSVQLAEIEPIGEQGDMAVVPALDDVISAQGENPPLETVAYAFDGRVETKWLDYANRNPATRSSWIQWQYLSPSNCVITGVQQLLKLRARANHGYPVQI